MSVTVGDLMKLPSLRRATVLGGHNGLMKPVSSISVLESTDPGYLVDGLFPQGEFFGSEIVITGFLNIPGDVEKQCANIQRLAEGGEVGLILFYVGVYLPEVDQRLIDLANELDFVLICMPVGEKNLRYGEVMSDVMECIYRDRTRNDTIVTDILTRISELPPHLQSVNTVLKMLSDRISSSLVLCGNSGKILNLVAWPRNLAPLIKAGLEQETFRHEGRGPFDCSFLPDARSYIIPIQTEMGKEYDLVLIKEVNALTEKDLEQAEDTVRICINIWGRQHDEIAVHELVRAIIQDEPLKMRRLADIFHVDVASIHEMWIVQVCEAQILEEQIRDVKELLAGQTETSVIDLYEGKLLIFMNTPSSLRVSQQLSKSVLGLIRQTAQLSTLTRCPGLQNTTDVREAYLLHQQYLSDARQIYPLRSTFTLGEIAFARTCRSIIEKGEHELNACLDRLHQLQAENEDLFVQDTLGAFLLDANGSITNAASILFLHINTVKYRISKISDSLGSRSNAMPEGYPIYLAVAVSRLLR